MKALHNNDSLLYTTADVGCKINLFLDIGERESNGFHSLRTLFYPLPNPFDTISIQEIETKICTVQCSSYIAEKENIIYKTYSAVQEYLHSINMELPCGYSISIEKRIPMGGGLGGGSANAGYILRYFQKRFGKTLFSDSVLLELASKLGSDVPFFLHNIPMLATGRGDVLTKSDISLEGMYIVLLVLREKIDTKHAFETLDIFRENNKKCLTTFSKYSKNYEGLTVFVNSFEEVLFKQYPQMRECKEIFMRNGASFAMLSGSGSSIFGIFRKCEGVSKAVYAVQNIVEGVYSYYL